MIQQLICHFQNVRVVTSKGKLFEIRFEELKHSSKELFLSLMYQKEINSFILDFYHFSGIYESSGNSKKYKLIKECKNFINEESINPTHLQEFNAIWNFLDLVYSDYRYILVCPNWMLTNDIANSLVVKFLASKFEEIYLVSDTVSSHINGVFLFRG